MAAGEELRTRRRLALGSRLRELRTEKGLSQEAVAHMAGLDRSFYVEIETAKHSVVLDRLYDIADALEVPVQDLFGQTAPTSE